MTPPDSLELALAEAAIAREPKNWTEYIRRLKRAAALGNAEAQQNLAVWYLEGLSDERGVRILKRSPASAIGWLRKAAASKNRLAIFRLGYCYDVGEGVRQDKALALKFYRTAFRRGIKQAAWNASTIGRERGDRRLELAWLRRGAKAGDVDAQLGLAVNRLQRSRRASEISQAIAYLRRLAKSSDPSADEAMVALASAYERGVGVAPSFVQARRWLERAAGLGNAEAIQRLASQGVTE